MGLQQLAPQIVAIRFRHCRFAAESRRNLLYTYIENALKYEILRPVFGTRTAEDISKQEVLRWLVTTAADRGWAPATKNRWQAAFSLAFRVGIEDEKIEKNPAARIGRTKEDNGRVRWLSEQEEAKLRAAMHAEPATSPGIRS